ncbi:ParA family protein [Weissella confusa]|uniref:ParA family protein n=1 Tax=Weissella confusa TaxID=1583 RepID=UPI0021A72BF9|nr:ParA family protein [Weissella confusa]MCT2911066.1 ParA family protein [Weissella confusa]
MAESTNVNTTEIADNTSQNTAKVISIINMKGGVGKTTLTVNMAKYYADRGKKILVIDMDPQFNSTQSLIQLKLALNPQIEEQLTNDASDDELADDELDDELEDESDESDELNKPSVVRNSAAYYRELSDKNQTIKAMFNMRNVAEEQELILDITDNLDIIPGDLSLTFVNRGDTDPMNHVIQGYFDDHDILSKYDFVLIDNAPTWTPVLTLSSLHAADYFLIPTKLEFYSSLGIQLLLDQIKTYEEQKWDSLRIKPLGIVPMFTSSIKAEQSVLNTLENRFGSKSNGIDYHIFRTNIPNNNSAGSKFTIYDSVKSQTRYSTIINAFDRLMEEVDGRIEELDNQENNHE